jgi:pimeloyl-ACP methyl ester carboxylesterase
MFITLSDGTNIYYNIAGKEEAMDPTAPTLIILHGGPGISDHTLYQPFWSKLQAIIQVVLIDMRGHGRSDGYDNPEKWTLKQWGKDVYDFCGQAQLEKPIIAGVSFGGWVVLSYATLYPNHPKALILCHTEAAVDIDVRKSAYMSKAVMFGNNPEEIGTIVQRIYDWESGEISRELY